MLRSAPYLSRFLREEIIHHKDKRATFVLQKLAFVTSLFGLGFIKITEFNLNELFYIIPYAAIAYDAFISAEDYKVKRVGIYLRTHVRCSTNCDRDWEEFVQTHRESWAAYTSLALSVLVLAASAFVASRHSPIASHYFVAWIAEDLCLIVLVFYHYYVITSNLDKELVPDPVTKQRVAA